MTLTNGKALAKYANLKVDIAQLEKELEELKPVVMVQVLEAPDFELDTDFGTFTVSQRKSWKYTEKIEKLTDALKAEKAKEEILGKATHTVSNVLIFKS